ncbi:MAG TPA: serine/threonine-protein kinase [Polyangia bacterium]
MTDRDTPVTIGRLFADKYRVDGLLGNGGMGMVFAATHLQLETRVAIKLLRTDMSRTETATARLLREARATARINSENVARVLDIGTVDWGGLYIVMEYLEGQDLAALMQKQPLWSPSEAVGVMLQACEGVRAAHALGIIHRDLKPSNLFVTNDASGARRIKVLDFGVSKLVDPITGSPVVSRGGAGPLTRPDSMLGSPVYMSPEQLNDPRAVNVQTDIWSLGVILFELLAGRPPFQAKALPELCTLILHENAPPLRSLRPDLPSALEAILEKCLKRTAAERYATVGALMKDLAPFAAPADAPPMSPSPSLPVGPRRWIAVAVGLLLILGLAGLVARLRRAAPAATALTEALIKDAATTSIVIVPTVAVQSCSTCVGANCAKEYKACQTNRACRRTLAAYNACVQTAANPPAAGCWGKLETNRGLAAQRLASCVVGHAGSASGVPGKCASACNSSTLN